MLLPRPNWSSLSLYVSLKGLVSYCVNVSMRLLFPVALNMMVPGVYINSWLPLAH